MTETLIMQTVCLRCGFVNENELVLTSKDTKATFRCELCKFINLETWTEEID